MEGEQYHLMYLHYAPIAQDLLSQRKNGQSFPQTCLQFGDNFINFPCLLWTWITIALSLPRASFEPRDHGMIKQGLGHCCDLVSTWCLDYALLWLDGVGKRNQKDRIEPYILAEPSTRWVHKHQPLFPNIFCVELTLWSLSLVVCFQFSIRLDDQPRVPFLQPQQKNRTQWPRGIQFS